MGRGIIEAELFRAERYGFELRTSDPANTEKGDGWFRTDVTPDTNQVATFRFDNGSGTWDVPVYDDAQSVSDGVVKVLRIPIGGSYAFMPALDSGAAFNQLGFYHNSTRYGLHDNFEVAIPDSEDLHARYDATELSLNDGEAVSTWADGTGNGHDLSQGTASNQPTFRTGIINNNPVVRHDTGEWLETAFNALSQPTSIFFAGQFRALPADGTDDYAVGSTETRHNIIAGGSGAWSIYAGAAVSGGSTDTNPHSFGGIFDTTDSLLVVDNTTVATGDAGSNALDGFRTAGNLQDSVFASIDLLEILVYPSDKRSIRGDVHSYFNSKYGPF